jgi:aspartyl-tRNA(Asn)/glutamyl-tRNA(Gln) amidotransferase subunit C
MSLTLEEVAYVARLARMQLEPDELETMQAQLSAILDYVEILQELDVEDVPITAQVSGLSTVMRPDAVLPSLTHEEALGNAPRHAETMFQVKAVFEE